MKTKENSLEDRISKLPDEILINILSRMTIKEAAITSLLSSRWRYLWTFFNGSLNFDDLLDLSDLKLSIDSCRDYDYNVYLRRTRLAIWIDQILGTLRTQTVEELKIRLGEIAICDVDNWFKFAIEKRIKRLELDFSCWVTICEPYPFPSKVDISSSFRSLTSLCLKNVDVTNEIVENLLRYCQLLEVLSLQVTKRVTSIKVSGPSLQLKYLELKFLPNLKDLEIDSANLISFKYAGAEFNANFRHVPSLVEMFIEGYYCEFFVHNLYKLTSVAAQLRTLKLLLMTATLPEAVLCSIPELPNLKHLELSILICENCFLTCASFLKASPSLYKLTVKLLYIPSVYVQRIMKHPHLSLRVLELTGFQWLEADIEFLTDLVENAVMLEKIIIDICRPHYLGTSRELLYRNTEYYQSARKRAVEFVAKFPRLESVIL